MNSKAGRVAGIRERTAIALLICAMALVSAGCSNRYRREQTGLPPNRTSGQVLVDGQPAAGVKITLLPVEGASEENPLAMGQTDEEGRFELSTYNAHDGAPAGEYNVVLTWIKILDPSLREQDQPPEAQQLPWKYQDPSRHFLPRQRPNHWGGSLLTRHDYPAGSRRAVEDTIAGRMRRAAKCLEFRRAGHERRPDSSRLRSIDHA
jgi:5-hydroxyisourate hydrolase-like protein (transthyretin family)